MNDATIIAGGCLCGQIRFEITTPTRLCAHCHCRMCRLAHGAPLVTWNGVPAERFRVTAREELLTHYQSSAQARRSFCSVCVTSLFFESERWAAEVHVATACLEQTDRPPAAHVYYSDRADWMAVADDLPKLGGACGVEPL